MSGLRFYSSGSDCGLDWCPIFSALALNWGLDAGWCPVFLFAVIVSRKHNIFATVGDCLSKVSSVLVDAAGRGGDTASAVAPETFWLLSFREGLLVFGSAALEQWIVIVRVIGCVISSHV